MDELQTCCPQCQALFPLTQQQLDAAAGKVRCGSCLAIFDATDYLVGSKEEADTSASITPLSDEDFAQLDGNDSPKRPQNIQHQNLDYEADAASNNNQEEDWAAALLDDNDDYQASPRAIEQQHKASPQTDTTEAPSPLTANKDDELDHDVFEQLSSAQQQDLISAIASDPLEFEIERKPFAKTKTLIAWLLTICGLLALVAQYIAFNFEQLAQRQDLRPIFAQVCQLSGCQLPNRNNSKLIKTSNLIVRSHPERKDALVADALLINRANFSQDYPELELIFTNLRQQVVASRRFSPEEYLDGELKGQTQMPIKQAIHISLQFLDPGNKAVNYQLQLHPQPKL